MRDEASKIPTNDAMPCSACSRVEFFFDVLGNVFLDAILLKAVLLHSFCGNFDGLLLHLFTLFGILASLDAEFVGVCHTMSADLIWTGGTISWDSSLDCV